MAQTNLPEKKEPDFQDLLDKAGNQTTTKPGTNPLAIASLALALLPIVFSCISVFSLNNIILFAVINGICYIAAIVVGSIAKKQIKASNNAQQGKALANWGIGLGILAIILSIIGVVLLITGVIAGTDALITWISGMLGGAAGY